MKSTKVRAPTERRNLGIVGGGELAEQFHHRSLLDELFVPVRPASVTLGSGKALLPRMIVNPSLHPISMRQVGAGWPSSTTQCLVRRPYH